MWALRRASTPIRNQVLGIGASYTCLKLDALTACKDATCGVATTHASSNSFMLSNWFYHTSHVPSNHGVDRRSLSSQAGATDSGEEDDLEDGFSELESTPTTSSLQNIDAEDEVEDLFNSDPQLSDDDNHDATELSRNDTSLSEKAIDMDEPIPSKRMALSELFHAIMNSPGFSVHNALDKWVKDGKDLSRSEISSTMMSLRRRRLYRSALQFSEWLEANKHLDFIERDYASRLDLIAKVHGLQKAENYIEKIPKSFRSEIIYRTLLANCVAAYNMKKSEDIFNKMIVLEFPVTAFSCNQLLLLYKRLDKKRIADVLSLMEKEHIKPSLFTYKLLIDTKGQSRDIAGMDEVIETMRASGIEPDINTQAIMVKHYASNGHKEKAIAVLKEIEGNDLKKKRWACRFLLPLYGEMKMTDEIERVWNICEPDPSMDECMSAIFAWGKVDNVEKAEAIHDRMLKTGKKLSPRQYNVMLKVYVDHKMLTKGKDLVKSMADKGCPLGALSWDALIKLHVEAGDVEKADSILHGAIKQNKLKPMLCTLVKIFDEYVKRGDVHNSEKIFQRMREAGYVSRPRQFQSLLQAYVNGKAPAYGMRERIKADNISLNKPLLILLSQVDPFKRTALSDLLD